MDGEMILFNANIAVHNRANSYDNHDPIRKRRLLMQKREIRKLKQKQDEKGLTLVPLRMYFRCSSTPFLCCPIIFSDLDLPTPVPCVQQPPF